MSKAILHNQKPFVKFVAPTRPWALRFSLNSYWVESELSFISLLSLSFLSRSRVVYNFQQSCVRRSQQIITRFSYHDSIMLAVYTTRAIVNCQPYANHNSVQQTSPCKQNHINSITSVPTLSSHPRGFCYDIVCNSLCTWQGHKLHNVHHHVMLRITPQKCLCQLRDSSSEDDEYRSSRNIAITLFKRYRNFIDRGGGDNLKEFISAGVNAYALGCTDEGLRKELIDMKDSGFEVEAMQSYGGSTSLTSKIIPEEIDECILWLSIIFITILCTPQPTIVRWSSIPPVSDEVRLQWKGFCALIANAYYVKGMAWLPVKTLQLEQMAVVGRAEEPSVVASRMQLVFSTLEVVSPQWPRV